MSASHPTDRAPLRGVGYFRKSNEDDGTSVEQQADWARAAAPAGGISLLKCFTDQAKKGHETARRTDFLAMLRFCEEEYRAGRPIHVVVCWHTNRFSRSDSIETAAFLQRLREAGVIGIFTHDKGLLRFDDPTARVMFNIEQDTCNNAYVVNLAGDSTRGKRDAALCGQHNGGQAPDGYRLQSREERVKGKRRFVPLPYVIDPERAPIIRRMFTRFASARLSPGALAAELNDDGIRTRNGRKWIARKVRDVLTNRKYVGDMTYGVKATGKFFCVADAVGTVVKGNGTGKTRYKARSEVIVYTDAHEPLVDPATFDEVQRRLAARRRAGKAMSGPTPGQLARAASADGGPCDPLAAGPDDRTGASSDCGAPRLPGGQGGPSGYDGTVVPSGEGGGSEASRGRGAAAGGAYHWTTPGSGPFSGLLVCGHCGRQMMLRTLPGRGKTSRSVRTRHYVCATYHSSGGRNCGRHLIGEAEVRAFVLDRLRAALRDPARLERLQAEVQCQDADADRGQDADADRDVSHLSQLDMSIRQAVANACREPNESLADQYRQHARELQEEQQAIRQRIAARQDAGRPAKETVAVRAARAVALLDRIAEGAGSLDTAEEREMLWEVVAKVVLFFDRIACKERFRYPFLRALMYVREDKIMGAEPDPSSARRGQDCNPALIVSYRPSGPDAA